MLVGDLEAHGPVEPAPAQLQLDRLEQVVGLLVLERQVGVAGDAERRRLLDHHAGEQRVQLGGDQLLDGHEARARRPREAREDGRHLDPGEAAIVGLGVGDHRGDAEGEVGDVRERVAGIDGERGQHREDALLVDLASAACGRRRRDRPSRRWRCPSAASSGNSWSRNTRLLAGDELAGALGDRGQLLGGGAAVGASVPRCRRRPGPSGRRRGPGRTRRGWSW